MLELNVHSDTKQQNNRYDMHARHAVADKAVTRTSLSLSLSLTHPCAQIHDLTVGRRAAKGDSVNNIKLGFKPVCESSANSKPAV